MKEVEASRDELLRVVLEPEDKAAFYRELLLKHWLPLPETSSSLNCTVYAVDSSDRVIELAGGGVIHIARSAALSNRQDKARKLRLHAFYPPSDEELSEYRKLMREHLEHEVALEAIQNLSAGDTVLIDGSIFGRMTHVFRVLRIPGREDFMFNYIETFQALLETCIKKNILLLGVAKDSRSTLLKDALLTELLLKKIEKYDPETQLKIIALLRNLHREIRTVSEIARKIPDIVYEKIRYILKELLYRMPDYKLIMTSRVGTGYSHPLRLELSRVSSGFVEMIFTPKQRAKLARKIVANLPAGKADEQRTHKTLEHIASYPPVTVLYVKFTENDLPLRVDVVHRDIKEWQIEEYTGFVVKGWKQVVIRCLGLLSSLYAGLKNYNVLLTCVDQYVKFTRQSRDYYKSKIESSLNTLIQQSRGVRRVSFP